MFNFEYINGKSILKSDMLRSAEHFFTTRESVVTCKDLPLLKNECSDNLLLIANYLNISPSDIVSPVQTHSDNITIAKKKTQYDNTDALVLEDNDIAILLNFADCTPIILFDNLNNIGAVVHAGWRGTASKIVPKTLMFMNKRYSTKPENVTAIIGPAISGHNYQIDISVYTLLKSTLNNEYHDCFAYDKINKKYNADLKSINCHQLHELGVVSIDKCDYCTYDSVDRFFSYRKENGKTARHSAILKLN